jgi:hypothetical protein
MNKLRINRRLFQLWAHIVSSKKERFKRAESKRKSRADRIRLTEALARGDFFWMLELPLRMAAIHAEQQATIANAKHKAYISGIEL